MDDNAKRYLPFLNGSDLAVAYLISFGHSNHQIADELNLSESTVKSRISRMLRRSGFENRSQLGANAARLVLTLDLPVPTDLREWYYIK
jgi:DNA-binding NarL/FixJ family response regulator